MVYMCVATIFDMGGCIFTRSHPISLFCHVKITYIDTFTAEEVGHSQVNKRNVWANFIPEHGLWRNIWEAVLVGAQFLGTPRAEIGESLTCLYRTRLA